MYQVETQAITPLTVIEVLTSSDGMTGYIKLTKQGENPPPATKEQIMEALKANQIIYGIKESSLRNWQSGLSIILRLT